MQRLVFASLAAVLLALPGCELLESAPAATVSVQKEAGADACCPMDGAGATGDAAAAAATGDCGECPSAAAKSECAPSDCEDVTDCDKSLDCEMECDESACEIECEETPCETKPTDTPQ